MHTRKDFEYATELSSSNIRTLARNAAPSFMPRKHQDVSTAHITDQTVAGARSRDGTQQQMPPHSKARILEKSADAICHSNLLRPATPETVWPTASRLANRFNARLYPIRKSLWQGLTSSQSAPPKRPNGAAGRRQNAPKCIKNEAVCRPKPPKRFPSPPLKTPKRSGTAHAEGPKTHQKQGRLRTENDASKSGKKKPLAKLWHSHRGWLHGQTARLSKSQNGSRSPPLKTPKRSGTARAEGPKTHQKQGRLRTENDASKSGKKKPLAARERLGNAQAARRGARKTLSQGQNKRIIGTCLLAFV